MKIPDYTIPIYFHAQSDQNVPSCRKKVEKIEESMNCSRKNSTQIFNKKFSKIKLENY